MTIDLTISRVTDPSGVIELALPPGDWFLAFAEGRPHHRIQILPGQVEARVDIVAEP